jgi:hypothetical protein
MSAGSAGELTSRISGHFPTLAPKLESPAKSEQYRVEGLTTLCADKLFFESDLIAVLRQNYIYLSLEIAEVFLLSNPSEAAYVG